MEMLEGKDRYFITDDEGSEIAEVTFTWPSDSVLSIDHTFVDPKYRGQKLAQQLIQAVIDKAIREDKKVIPSCSYARAQFDRVKEYQKLEYMGHN
ncbi:N-acetyltransferase [Sporolactobacillus shoreae]|uniref:N-acetyltransferase n=1 Tax=Sporolactobacillus shoreae TaxID=1465501 RepID=A0A4Z0GLI1_9BACL|nr:GNAT family N-acetyltransferase [Sporolactobacillus shoreae]TGA97023.1 N-acetyltransferase [Sporolactobacillus shoreae]